MLLYKAVPVAALDVRIHPVWGNTQTLHLQMLTGIHGAKRKGKRKMSNKARKERKRSGKKFSKEPKVGTPLEQRAIKTVYEPESGKIHPSKRAYRRIKEAIEIRDGVTKDGAKTAAD
jgi:hypothetical protein